MGCGASSESKGGSAGQQSYDATKEAMEKASALKPQTQKGLDEQKRLDADFERLKEQIIAGKAEKGGDFKIVEVAQVVAKSDYVLHLAESLSPTRAYDAGWAIVHIPDNGQWKVAHDKRSGQVRIEPAAKVLGANMGFSFAPMRSEVDSAGYRDMFRANLARVFSDLPKTIQGSMVMAWEQQDSTGPYIVGGGADGGAGLDVFEWRIQSEIFHGKALQKIGSTQIEVHGMRNEAKPTAGGFQFFGFNGSMSCSGHPDGAHMAVERVFREVVLGSLQIKTIEVIEKEFIGFWKQ